MGKSNTTKKGNKEARIPPCTKDWKTRIERLFGTVNKEFIIKTNGTCTTP
jgi:hypothetical protein